MVNLVVLQKWMLIIWPLLCPVFVILRQVIGYNNIGDIYKFYVAILACLFAIGFFLNNFISRQVCYWMIGLMGSVLFGTLLTAIDGKFLLSSALSQASSILLFAIFFSSMTNNLANSIYITSKRLIFPNLVFNALLLICFRFDIFGSAGYKTFDASGLVLTFASSLISGNYFYTACHLIIMFFCGKRALFIAAAICCLFFGLGHKMKYLFYMGIPLVIASFFLLIIKYLPNSMINLDDSLMERFSEIYSGYSEWMIDLKRIIFGSGIGWTYNLIGYNVDYTQVEVRSYFHISPAFFHFCFGVFGLLFFVYIINISRSHLAAKNHILGFFAVYVLTSSIISFSRLNFFTEPLLAASVGALMLPILLLRGEQLYVPYKIFKKQ